MTDPAGARGPLDPVIADFEYGPFKAKVAELQGVIRAMAAALDESHTREVLLERRAERWKEAARYYRWLSWTTGSGALTHREKRALYRGSRR